MPPTPLEVIRLADAASDVQVSIVPSIGNMAVEMTVRGRNILWFPFTTLEALQATPTLCAVPFLGPWANRIDGDAYWSNGRKFLLNADLGNLRRDGNGLPIHGLLTHSPLWTVIDRGPDHVTSRIEFWRYPTLMAQFPFAHNLAMTYRLANGELEVETRIENLATEQIPVSVGFHPYFRLHDSPRDKWRVHLPAQDHLLLNEHLTPTGAVRRVELPDPYPLRNSHLDDVFTTLVRDPDGRARFWVEGKHERITVAYGPKYTVAVVYAPPGRDFICFEPMSAVTNAFNLSHAGIYDGLQTVPPGEEWRESFWISAAGF